MPEKAKNEVWQNTLVWKNTLAFFPDSDFAKQMQKRRPATGEQVDKENASIGGSGNRNRDLLHAKQTFYQLNYAPTQICFTRF